MILVIAQWERETIAERTKAALAYKIKNGQRVGEVRYGFDLAADGKSLMPNEQEQQAIAVMRQLRTEGSSYRAIAEELMARGVAAKNGGAWNPSTISRILRRAS